MAKITMNGAGGARCTLRAHGATQLQIKAYYPFEDRRVSSYRMELYLIVPRQISIRLDETGRRELLDDTRTDTRFTVTNLPASLLGDKSFEDSPLHRINRELDNATGRSDSHYRRIEYEIRTFCNLFSFQLKSTVAMTLNLIGDPAHREEAIGRIRQFIKDGRDTLDAFRRIRERLVDPAVPDTVRQAHILADEYLGDQLVRHLLNLSVSLENRQIDEKILSQLDKATKKELAYQTEHGYSAVRSDTIFPDDERALELLVVRESRLKKWVQSVLYLDVAESGTPRRIGHAIASVAAAMAMSVAVLAAFFADRLYASYSVPWALLIVGSYILKDRIKEILRGSLERYFPMAISDRTRILKDPATQKNAGRARLAIRNVRPEDIPVRPVDPNRGVVRDELLSETVARSGVVFATEVRLRGKRLLANHRRVDGIVDISRIRLDKWLRDMDAPIKGVRLFVDRKPVLVQAPRTYRIQVAVRLSASDSSAESLYFWTIVLDRDGIRRIERDRL